MQIYMNLHYNLMSMAGTSIVKFKFNYSSRGPNVKVENYINARKLHDR